LTHIEIKCWKLIYIKHKDKQLHRLLNIIDEIINLSKLQWKILLRKAIKSYSDVAIQKSLKSYSKLRKKDLEKENLEVKDYAMPGLISESAQT
jgi:hypothetical protein